jgi:hypothetical protein
MPISTNTAWNTANNAPAKMPIYVFQIAGQATVYSTHDLTRLGITGAPAFQPWLVTPKGASQTVDIVQCTSSIGDLQCEVVDVNGSIRQLNGENLLTGQPMQLFVGYPGLEWSQFVVLQSYVIYKIIPSDGYTSFLFVCRDPQILEKTTVYLHPENGGLLSGNNPWYLCGSPIDCYLAIILFAAGLPASLVDVATLLDLNGPGEGLYYAARPFQFAITESFQAKQFIETEILKPSLIYQVVTNLGQLSLRAPRPPAGGPVPVFTFTPDNMTILPKIDRMPILNQAVWQFDYGLNGGSGYGNFNTYLQASSISQFGLGDQEFTVNSQGLKSALGAFWWTADVSGKLFRRFAGTPTGLKGGAPVYNIEAFLMSLPVWLGDYVAVTHPQIPDILTGNLGITNRIMEVVDREPDYQSGKMSYKLLDTGLTSQPPAAVWGSGTNAFLFGESLLY